MKKSFLLLLFTGISSISLLAQPTLTAADAYKAGDAISAQALNSATLSSSSYLPTGANKTWDFSGVPTAGAVGSSNIVVASTTTYASDFPSANLAQDNGGTTDYYFNVAGNTQEIYGYESAGGISLIYTNPETFLTFPFTYGSTLSDNFAANGISSAPYAREGNVTVKGDAYGTLKTPAGTYNSSLRIKIDQTIHDDFGQGIYYDYHLVTYDWFAPGYDSYLFYLSYDTTYITLDVGETDTLTDITAIQAVNVPATVGVNNIAANHALKVFPTLTANNIFIYTDESINAISITNVFGEKVLELPERNIEPGRTVKLSVADLPAGVYLCTLSTPSGLLSRKIVKE